MQLHEILLGLVALGISYLVAGLIYREIWHLGLKRGKFQKGFDEILAKSKVMKKIERIEAKIDDPKSKVMKKIERIEAKIDDPNFEKNVGKAMFQSTRGEKGGTMKAIYAEQKEMMGDLGELGSFKYQNLIQLMKELDGLIDNGLIKKEWGEKFLKWANIPRAQPFLDNLAKGVFETLDGDHGKNASYGSGGQKWL